MYTYTRRVKYYETDRMGVIHHSNYLKIVEEARMQWLNDNIMRYSDMEKLGIIIPTVTATEHFRMFLRFDDLMEIRVIPLKYTGVKISFAYEIYNGDTGVLCYNGESELFFATDPEYRPFSLKKEFPEIHEKMKKAFEENVNKSI